MFRLIVMFFYFFLVSGCTSKKIEDISAFPPTIEIVKTSNNTTIKSYASIHSSSYDAKDVRIELKFLNGQVMEGENIYPLSYEDEIEFESFFQCLVQDTGFKVSHVDDEYKIVTDNYYWTITPITYCVLPRILYAAKLSKLTNKRLFDYDLTDPDFTENNPIPMHK